MLRVRQGSGQSASKALELEGTLGEPHFDLAVTAEYEFDWATAEKKFRKGIERSPGDTVGRIWYAWYLALVGRKADVLVQRTVAARLDLVSPWAVQSGGAYYSAVGRYGAAVGAIPKPCRGNALEELRLADQYIPGPRQLGHLGYAYAVRPPRRAEFYGAAAPDSGFCDC
jgi:hypothetical protein